MARLVVKKTKCKPRAKAPQSKTKKTKGRLKGGHSRGRGEPVTEAEAEEMFRIYCDHPSLRYVAQKCNRCITTIRLWRDKQKWPERLGRIRAEARGRVEHDTAKMIARQVRMCQEIQDIAAAAIRKKRFRSKREKTSEAVQASLEAAKTERVLLGEPGDRVEIIGTLQERYANRKQTSGDQG